MGEDRESRHKTGRLTHKALASVQPAVQMAFSRSDTACVVRLVCWQIVESWKDLKHLFTHSGAAPAGLSYAQVRKALSKINIDMTDKQFSKLMAGKLRLAPARPG